MRTATSRFIPKKNLQRESRDSYTLVISKLKKISEELTFQSIVRIHDVFSKGKQKHGKNKDNI